MGETAIPIPGVNDRIDLLPRGPFALVWSPRLLLLYGHGKKTACPRVRAAVAAVTLAES
jgi:hypothetical protein